MREFLVLSVPRSVIRLYQSVPYAFRKRYLRSDGASSRALRMIDSGRNGWQAIWANARYSHRMQGWTGNPYE